MTLLPGWASRDGELAVDARDPEGGVLGIFVHWGDEAEDSAETVVVGSNAAHNYAYPTDAQSYSARVRVVDATDQRPAGRSRWRSLTKRPSSMKYRPSKCANWFG